MGYAVADPDMRELTLTPTQLMPADVVYAAGWSERALGDAVLVCALFNFMNRLVEGLGMIAEDDYFSTAAGRLRDRGYTALSRLRL